MRPVKRRTSDKEYLVDKMLQEIERLKASVLAQPGYRALASSIRKLLAEALLRLPQLQPSSFLDPREDRGN